MSDALPKRMTEDFYLQNSICYLFLHDQCDMFHDDNILVSRFSLIDAMVIQYVLNTLL